ncbi:deazaflavin-dependent nitroreductase family protein [Mycolicibacterium novocastrense]|uniref:Deazaflavin-dependent nitroreductase family protein n=1 Tax=Mycolicibacterium novocastrense TaxID=59813 RepID=A0ABQ0KKT6_MYCNV|nr:deazaflavin-dependent nitroreductase family protein [Mycolicibacterium novocastrense]
MAVRSFGDANPFHRVMRRVAGTKAGRVIFRPTAHRLDQLVSKLSGGKYSFAGIAAGLPTVILTTTGAKSGKPRAVALLGIPHPDGVAVVAANYGGATHPGWYYNLGRTRRHGSRSRATPGMPPPGSPRRTSEKGYGHGAYGCIQVSARKKSGPATGGSRRSS